MGVGSIGFTGTRDLDAVSHLRLQKLMEMLTRFRERGYQDFHHGDCVGADAYAHGVVAWLGFNITIHPPTDSKHRAYCMGAVEVRARQAYLVRNHNIVNSCDVLLALPRDKNREVLRSGTWATVRYGWKQDKRVIVL